MPKVYNSMAVFWRLIHNTLTSQAHTMTFGFSVVCLISMKHFCIEWFCFNCLLYNYELQWESARKRERETPKYEQLINGQAPLIIVCVSFVWCLIFIMCEFCFDFHVRHCQVSDHKNEFIFFLSIHISLNVCAFFLQMLISSTFLFNALLCSIDKVWV